MLPLSTLNFTAEAVPTGEEGVLMYTFNTTLANSATIQASS